MEEAKAEAGAEGAVEEEAEAAGADAAEAEDTTGPNICLTTIPCGGGWVPTPPAAEAEAAGQAEEAILLPTAI